MDKKGKVFGLISIIDIVAILLVAALVLGTLYKFGGFGHTASDKKYDLIQYVIQVSGIRQQSIDALQPGDGIYDEKTGSYMGVIKSKTTKPALSQLIKADGTTVMASKPDRYDVLVTVEVPGVESNDSYLANGNKEINREGIQILSTRLSTIEAKVIEIKNLSKKQ